MIPFNRTDKPGELTADLQRELTDRFKATGESVWNIPFLKKALLEMSGYKCAYSECRLQEEGKYMEVEHFLPKEKYKDDVMEWDNLFPANKKCNVAKGDLDVNVYPIINPCVHTPRKHLILKNYRFYYKTELGKNTIDAVALNDREHFVKKRFKIGDKVHSDVSDLKDWFEVYFSGNDNSAIRLRNKRNKLVAIMEETRPEYEYSATVATVLIHDAHYLRIKEILEVRNEWTAELQALDDGMSEIAFDIA